MRRRTLLSTLGGGLAALAGCLGAGNPAASDSPSGTTDRTESPEPADATSPTDATSTQTAAPTGAAPTQTTASADVTVERVWLQYGVVTTATADSIGLSYPATPYLGASVRVDGSVPTDAFTLAVGEDGFSPSTVDGLYRTSWGDDVAYDPAMGGGLLLFEPPSDVSGGTRVSLNWPGGERGIDDGVTARLDGKPPQLSASIDGPATHDRPGAPSMSVEVTNEGDAPARFLGALNRHGPRVASMPVGRLSESVPGGESTTIPVDDSWHGLPATDRIGDDRPDVTYRLHYGDTQATSKIRIVEPE